MEQAEENERGDYCLPKELQDSKKHREKIKEVLDELDRVERKYLHPNDRDGRLMKCDGRLNFAFDAQVVVDDKSGLIGAGDVVNDEIDTGRLVPMIKKVERLKTQWPMIYTADFHSFFNLCKLHNYWVEGILVIV